MATPEIKPKQVRVYLREAEVETLEALVELTGMKDTSVLTHLCTAALRAAKEADYRVPLALKFNVSEASDSPPSRGTVPAKSRR